MLFLRCRAVIWHFHSAFYHYARFSFLHGNGQLRVHLYLKIELFSPCALNMHIYSEFYLPLCCPLSSMNYFICLHIVLVFTTLNCLVSSTNVVILLFALNKHAEEHKLEHSSTELPSETYQALFRVFSPITRVWCFDLSQDTLGV